MNSPGVGTQERSGQTLRFVVAGLVIALVMCKERRAWDALLRHLHLHLEGAVSGVGEGSGKQEEAARLFPGNEVLE